MGDEGLHSVAYRRAVPAQHHIDCPALVAGTDKLLTPIKTHRLGAMLPGRLDKIGPMAAPPKHETINRSSAFGAILSQAGCSWGRVFRRVAACG
jgi:hypothetical protein